MTRILRYIAVVATVCVGLAGCGGSHKVDARLALADSLIVDHADSAYTVLKAIDSEELLSESDRAFYALLYTQAQYKNVDSIGSDSLINIALDYYKDNHNREHYTRTLIYKGAVMEELGNPEEALEWYLRAENNAAPDDYLNLGQANLRMAVLYSNNYSDYNLKIQKYAKALNCYYLAENAQYQLMCLSGLGGSYRICNMDSAYYYLDKALELAEEMGNEGELYSCTEMKVRGMLEDSLHHEAKTLALDYLNTKGTEYVDDDLYYDLANAYIGLGNVDSAQYYFNKTTEPVDERKLVSYKWIASLINEMKGKYEQAHNYNKSADSLADKIISSRVGDKLVSQEKLYINDNHKNEQFFLENINNRYKIILIIAFLSLIMLTYFLYSRRKAHKKELDSYRSLMMNYKNEIIKNKQNAESFQNLELELLTKYNLYILNEIKTCAVNFESKPEYYRDKLKNIGKELQYKNNDFWIVLKNIVNEKHNNALIKIQQEFSTVSDEDLKIIAMIFMKFSVTTMGICMGFTNEKSIYQRKKRIAQKMNISESLEDFLAQKMLKKIC